MRTSERVASVCVVAVSLIVPAYAFDGTAQTGMPTAGGMDLIQRAPAPPVSSGVAPAALAAPGPTLTTPVPSLVAPPFKGFDLSRKPSADEAFRVATQALNAGDLKTGLSALEYAAANNHPLAQWKLARMYANGEGVDRDDYKAFKLYSDLVDEHADDNPMMPQSRFVSNAFVALGLYYLDGIPHSPVAADPDRAREMFQYAASYFGDADAQYNLGKLHLNGIGAPKDIKLAARWLRLAAIKGQHQAQALFGSMLFKGAVGPRQAARGLMWLTLASDAAAAQETWIHDLYDEAFKAATDDERQAALLFLEQRLNRGRQPVDRAGDRPN